jgi:hypothetical protein
MHQRRTVIAAVEGYEIRFKGESFNQTDLDVWEMLLHRARLHPMGGEVEFTAHSLLQELGRGIGGNDHEQLKEELVRLGSGWTEITDTKAKKTFAGNFISSFVRDDEIDRYVITFSPKMAQLYEAGNTLIDWEQRLALGRKNLAKWLQGHYATHAKPYPYKVVTLRDLSGSTTTVKAFKQSLKKALDVLKAIGAILNWSIDEDDLVHVVRSPSGSQRKHLAQKAKPSRVQGLRPAHKVPPNSRSISEEVRTAVALRSHGLCPYPTSSIPDTALAWTCPTVKTLTDNRHHLVLGHFA